MHHALLDPITVLIFSAKVANGSLSSSSLLSHLLSSEMLQPLLEIALRETGIEVSNKDRRQDLLLPFIQLQRADSVDRFHLISSVLPRSRNEALHLNKTKEGRKGELQFLRSCKNSTRG